MDLELLHGVLFLTQTATYILFFDIVMIKKHNRLITWLIIVLGIAVAPILDFIKIDLWIKTLIGVPSIIISYLIASQKGTKHRILNIATYVGISITAEVLSQIFAGLLAPEMWFDYEFLSRISSIRMMGISFYCIVFSFLSMLYAILIGDYYNNYKVKAIILITTLYSTHVLLLCGLYNNNKCVIDEVMFGWGTVSSIAIILSGYITYYCLNNIEAKNKSLQQLKFYEMQQKYLMEYYTLAILHNDETQRLRHDFSNKLQIAYQLFNSNANLGKKMLDGIKDETQSISIVFHTGNQIVDTILTVKRAQAIEHQIKTDIQVTPLNNIGVSDMNLCSIFSNVFDNAIESCEKLDVENRWINIRIGQKLEYTVLRVSNPHDGKIIKNRAGEYKSNKSDHSVHEHGCGLRNIKDIVKKCNGEVFISSNNGVFEITISLRQKDVE